MYLLHGKLSAKAGHRDELADILLDASKLVAAVKGCKVYAIGKDNRDQNSVYVTEIWDSKEDHDNSLKAESVRELIMKAMPIIDGQPQRAKSLKYLGVPGYKMFYCLHGNFKDRTFNDETNLHIFKC
jgi:quinol monooxygenase YgiN